MVCYDREKPLAAILHGMLPEKPARKPDSNRYLDCGIGSLIKEMISAGSGIKSMEAKIFGGASMFDIKQDADSIGDRNVKMAKETLKKAGIPVVGEDTGSAHGRNIEFSVDEKKATVRSFASGTKII